MNNNLKNYYKNITTKEFIDKNIAKNIMQVPKLIKIVINIGLGLSGTNKKNLNDALNELMLISGQKPIIIKAKRSIAGFKIRKDFDIACKVTLRGDKMYNFLDKLIFIALPRVRDFRGINIKSFDGNGNYSLGIKEHIIFPEINYDKIENIKGMDISIVTNAKTDKIGEMLLKSLKFPFN